MFKRDFQNNDVPLGATRTLTCVSLCLQQARHEEFEAHAMQGGHYWSAFTS